MKCGISAFYSVFFGDGFAKTLKLFLIVDLKNTNDVAHLWLTSLTSFLTENRYEVYYSELNMKSDHLPSYFINIYITCLIFRSSSVTNGF